MKRQFILPEEDIEFLDSIGYKWEARVDGNNKWVIICDYEVPDGYSHKNVEVALRIDPGYPVSQIDMVYFCPALNLVDGRQPGALTNMAFLGKTWQRWSRHRTGHNPWRPGVDNLSTHVQLVNYWLERELKK